MKYRILYLLIILITHLFAQEETKGIKLGSIADMSGNWFISYHNGIEQIHADQDTPEQSVIQNEFLLKRSYFTLKKDLNDLFSVRYTMDLTIDSEGEDAGNVETRLKYLFLKINPKIKSDIFKQTSISLGMVPTPWVEFEQKINTYRVQDNMFVERNKIFNSADFGFLCEGTLGAVLSDESPKYITNIMKAKYLGYAFGLYNGAGYSGQEKNANKVFESRLTIRPLAEKLPELLLSSYFNLGKGNSKDNPDFKQFLFFMAYTGKHLTLTTQTHFGNGDFKGSYVLANHPEIALKSVGYSSFAEYRFGNSPWAIFSRYDNFDVKETTKFDVTRYIGGVAYTVSDFLRIVANAERNETLKEDNNIYELNFEIKF